jgi:hypothetical protein
MLAAKEPRHEPSSGEGPDCRCAADLIPNMECDLDFRVDFAPFVLALFKLELWRYHGNLPSHYSF